jgi:hypothetical protein
MRLDNRLPPRPVRLFGVCPKEAVFGRCSVSLSPSSMVPLPYLLWMRQGMLLILLQNLPVGARNARTSSSVSSSSMTRGGTAAATNIAVCAMSLGAFCDGYFGVRWHCCFKVEGKSKKILRPEQGRKRVVD